MFSRLHRRVYFTLLARFNRTIRNSTLFLPQSYQWYVTRGILQLTRRYIVASAVQVCASVTSLIHYTLVDFILKSRVLMGQIFTLFVFALS
ncbi:hypothetical protein BJ138DRAFT_1072911 [Hygrophoropsis aurantiaca]|uniref:Uncharacterized protein n=1 Tax=Hygrophoropsis aurantiaca TaxID=72124 RepID=A0ACB7ZX05_9AGAM|nr:hypothetical protein BJ138DRAFT_1072911 [Hygrophoropsis aurantiaca]